MPLIEHLEKLRHFHKLTTYNSINEASKATGMSQAGLSKSIQGLESALETNLFLRSRDGLTLTKEGELLLHATKQILDLASGVDANLRSLRATNIPEKIRIGMYDSIAVYFFPVLSDYLKIIYPKVELELVVDKSANLSALVEDNQIDLSIGVNFNFKKNSKTEFFLLFEDHYCFYVSPENQKKAAKLPLIYHPEAMDKDTTANKNSLSSLLQNRSLHKAYNFETIKTLTKLGLGVGVLPNQVAMPLIKQKELVSISLPRFPHLFGKHSIGVLGSSKFLSNHREFTEDIYRLGQRWSKS